MKKPSALLISLLFSFFNFKALSSENDSKLTNYLEILKGRFEIIRNDKYPLNMPLPTAQDFKVIEDTFLSQRTFPRTLRELYEAVGNRTFTQVDLLKPLGGAQSRLYQYLSRHQEELDKGWLPFASGQGSEWYAIQLDSGKVQHFVREFEVAPYGEAHDSLADWIHALWIQENH
jgi:hypothetical protein